MPYSPDHGEEQAFSVMRKLNEEGIAFWFTQRFSKRERKRMEAAYACLVFISKDSISDEKTRRSIEYAVKYNKKILCVYLEPAPLNPGMELLLNALQSIDRSTYVDDQAFFEKLKSAEIFSNMQITAAQKKHAKRRALASVVLPIAAAAVIFITVVYPLLIAPNILAANGSMSKLGYGNLSLAELAEVEELRVVGNQTVNENYYATYMNDDEEREFVMGLSGIKPVGDISDISDLALLKNAKIIALEANQISDITPLYQIKSLEELILNCNPIKSIEGIEALQNLRSVCLNFTEVTDISPLFKLPLLDNINVRFSNVSSIEGIENLTQLTWLAMGYSNITDISALNSIDFSYIDDTDGFGFDAEYLHIEDYSPLQNISKFTAVVVCERGYNEILPYIENKQIYYLDIQNTTMTNIQSFASIQDIRELQLVSNSRLTSIDGIEDHDSIELIRLVQSPHIADYTPLLKLPNLERLTITSDMKPRVFVQLKDADFEIIIEDEQ